jgi:hypothetical protein
MKVTYSSAEVSLEIDLTGGHTLPVIDHGDQVGTMSVERVYLRYLSEGGKPWVTGWTCSGYSAATGHALLDLDSSRVNRARTPGWLIDLVASHRPKTGDRVSLPES